MKKKTKIFLFFASFALAFCCLANVSLNDSFSAHAESPGFQFSLDRINLDKVTVGERNYACFSGKSLATFSSLEFGPQNGVFTIDSGWIAAENGIKGYVYSIDGGDWQNASATISSRADLSGAGIPYSNGHSTAGLSNLIIENIPEKSNFKLAFVDLATDEKVTFYQFDRYTEVYKIDFLNNSWIRYYLTVNDYQTSDQGATSRMTETTFTSYFEFEIDGNMLDGSKFQGNSYITNYSGGPADKDQSLAVNIISPYGNRVDFSSLQSVKLKEGMLIPTYKYLKNKDDNNKYFELKTTVKYYKSGQTFVNSEEMNYNPFTAIAGGWNNKVSGDKRETILAFKNKFYSASEGTTCIATTGAHMYIDGTPLKDLNGAHVGYNHGNQYLYFYYPASILKEGTILKIDEGTIFYNSYLSYFEFKLVNDEWVLVKDYKEPSAYAKDLSLGDFTNGLYSLRLESTTAPYSPLSCKCSENPNEDIGDIHVSLKSIFISLPEDNSSFFLTFKGSNAYYGARFIIGPTKVCLYIICADAYAFYLGEATHNIPLNQLVTLDFYVFTFCTDAVNLLFRVNGNDVISKSYDKSAFYPEGTYAGGPYVSIIEGTKAGKFDLYDTTSTALAKAKEDAIEVAQGYYDELDLSKYSSTNKATLAGLLKDVKADINAETEIYKLAGLVETFKNAIGQVVTDLYNAKIAAIGDAQGYYDALDLSKYSTANKATLAGLLSDVKTNISNATDLDQVANILSTYQAAVDAVETDLYNAQVAAKASAKDYYDNLDLSKYSTTSKEVLAGLLDGANEAIDAATEPEDVQEILDAYKLAVDAVETDLYNAQVAAKASAKDYYDNLDLSKYSTTSKEVLAGILDGANEAIDAATEPEDVQEILDAYKLAVDAVETDLYNAQVAAKASAKDYYDKLDLSKYSTTSKEVLAGLLDGANEAIDAATEPEDVQEILDAYKLAVDAVEPDLYNAKIAALAEVQGYYDAIDMSKYSPMNQGELLGYLEYAKDAINEATSLDAVASAVTDFKTAVNGVETDLYNAKASALLEVNVLYNDLDMSKYSEANKALLKAAYDKAIADINASTTISGVQLAADTFANAIKAIEPDLYNAKTTAIAAAQAYNDALDKSKYSDANQKVLADLLAKVKEDINAAKDLTSIAQLLANYKEAVDKVETILPKKGGCGSSILAASALVTIISCCGVALLSLKKKND